MRELPITNYQLPMGERRKPGLARALVFLPCMTVVLGGCGSEEGKGSAVMAGREPVVRTASEGPVRLTLTVTAAEVPFTEPAQVVVEVVADKDVTVEVEDYDRAEGLAEHQYEFRLSRGERRSAVPTAEGKLKWTQSYELRFFLPGEYELPPASAAFVQTSPASGGEPGESQRRQISTEPIKVHAGDVSAATLSPEELRRLTSLPPVELPGRWSGWWWMAPCAGALLAFWVFMRGRRTPGAVIEIPIPAHEWARRELAALIAEDLIVRRRIQAFYYRVSDIVRGYIERRFGVTAPEMTTEEFLDAAGSDGRFPELHARELESFLVACDLVKYARQIPGSDEAEQVLQAAAGFVERTREDRVRTEGNGRVAAAVEATIS